MLKPFGSYQIPVKVGRAHPAPFCGKKCMCVCVA